MATQLDVFISSKMVELKAERDALYDLLPKLNYGDIQLRAWVFEEDAPASSRSIREVYLSALQNSALYIGLFWNQYGEWTIDEFDRATEWGVERQLYVKDVDADQRDPTLTAFLNKYSDVTRGITPKWFKTPDELCVAVKNSIETWIRQRLQGRSGGTTAVFAQHPDDLTDKPAKLFGRDDLLRDVTALLDNNERVLLHGFGGMGKTALAATLAAEWIGAGKGPVLWLKTGTAPAEALFEALARPFGAAQAVARETGDAQLQLMRQLLRQTGAKLLALDDCWNGAALFTLLNKAVPSDMPVLVTARQRYGIKTRDVGELSPADSLRLLSHHADRDYFSPSLLAERGSGGEVSPPLYEVGRGSGGGDNMAAPDLCRTLGHHAFAVEIAGRTLQAHKWTPAELLAKIAHAPDKLETPAEFREAGRETVARLIETSLNALDEAARAAFLAFGAFFAPALTAELLMLYFVGKPEIPDEQLADIRAQSPQLPPDMSDDELRNQVQQVLLQRINPEPADNALSTLVIHGLAERIAATDTAIAHYRVHDLAYSYAGAQATTDQRHRALDACLTYTARYDQPSLTNFAALRPVLDNCLNAAGWAFGVGRYSDTEAFTVLYFGTTLTGGFLALQGFSVQSISLLQQAAAAAEKSGNRQNQGVHLGNLGIAYYSLGQVERAIEQFDQLLALHQEIGDRRSEGNTLGNLGIAYYSLGQVERAIEYHQQALAVSREIGDRRGEGNRLGNLGLAYRDLGQVERAIEYHQQALAIRREIGDRRGEGSDLGNLGNAYSALGQVERAIEYHQQALAISREIGDRYAEGSILGNLGLAYYALGQAERAIDYHQQALAISREIGDRSNEGNQLGNLGLAYSDLGQYERAIDYHQQSNLIHREIGDRSGEANDLNNIGALYADQGEYARALDYYQQARAIFIVTGQQHLVAHVDRNIARAQAALSGGSGAGGEGDNDAGS